MKNYLFTMLLTFVCLVCAHAEQSDLPPAAEPVSLPQIDALFDDSQCQRPDYPLEAAQKGQQGTVTVAFYVGKNGRALDAKVAPSSGFPLLDAASINAVSSCDKFKPGIAYGKPIELLVTVAYEWRIGRAVAVRPGTNIGGQRIVGRARTPAVLTVPKCQPPPYPKEAARNEWQGTVILAFLVGVDGKVKEAKIERSSGHSVLDEQASKYLSACEHFKPGTRNGKPVEAWARVAYEWKID